MRYDKGVGLCALSARTPLTTASTQKLSKPRYHGHQTDQVRRRLQASAARDRAVVGGRQARYAGERPPRAPLHPRRSVRAGALSIPPPDPIAAIEHCMESRGLTRKVLEPFIGSRARVSEVMARRRPLTLRMIRRLTVGLGIPTDVLIQPYRIVDHRAA